jgi:hypothetical protein
MSAKAEKILIYVLAVLLVAALALALALPFIPVVIK